MKAIKIWAIIFSSLFFVSLVGLVFSTAATGYSIIEVFKDGGVLIGWGGSRDGYDVTETFDETYQNIEIGVISARTSIKISPDGVTRVNYRNGGDRISFTAHISGNTLIIKEQIIWSLFNWGSVRTSTLDIEIPEAVYNNISLSLVSGNIRGELPETDSFAISVVSGNINIGGLSGSGDVNVVSGKADLDFAEWNSSLKIDIVSGSVNIRLPRGSGANVDFSRISGSFKWTLDNDSGSLTRSASGVSLGGENRQGVNVDMTSGSVSITN